MFSSVSMHLPHAGLSGLSRPPSCAAWLCLLSLLLLDGTTVFGGTAAAEGCGLVQLPLLVALGIPTAAASSSNSPQQARPRAPDLTRPFCITAANDGSVKALLATGWEPVVPSSHPRSCVACPIVYLHCRKLPLWDMNAFPIKHLPKTCNGVYDLCPG